MEVGLAGLDVDWEVSEVSTLLTVTVTTVTVVTTSTVLMGTTAVVKACSIVIGIRLSVDIMGPATNSDEDTVPTLVAYNTVVSVETNVSCSAIVTLALYCLECFWLAMPVC